MATFKRLEEMPAWQSARELVQLVHEVTKQSGFNRDFALRDQCMWHSIKTTFHQ